MAFYKLVNWDEAIVFKYWLSMQIYSDLTFKGMSKHGYGLLLELKFHWYKEVTALCGMETNLVNILYMLCLI